MKSIDILTHFDKIIDKTNKLNRILKDGIMDKEVVIYVLGMERIRYQGIIYFINTTRQPVETRYKN